MRPTRKVNLTLHVLAGDFVIRSCYFFLRDLEARAQNEFFRAFFRLPRKEKLHEVVDCSLWTPFSRCHTAGTMYTSDSYICFASKENGCCTVIIPLREVEFFVCLILGPYLPFSSLSLCCHLSYLQSIVWWKRAAPQTHTSSLMLMETGLDPFQQCKSIFAWYQHRCWALPP